MNAYDQSTQHEAALSKNHPNDIPTGYTPISTQMNHGFLLGLQHTFLGLGNRPSEHMGDRLQDDNASEPAVNQIEGVKRHLKQGDQGIVPAGHEHHRDKVHCGHGSGAVADQARNRGLLGPIGYCNNAKDDVHDDDAHQDEGMEPTGQRAHVDSSGELKLAVVAGTEQRGIDDMVVDFREHAVGVNEIPLAFIVETCQSPHMTGKTMPHLPDINEGSH